MAEPNQEIQINLPPELQGGRYSNSMTVGHSKEEFVLDFMMVARPAGAVVARVVVSPGHLKRIVRALQENLGRYEARYGEIREAGEPSPTDFRPN